MKEWKGECARLIRKKKNSRKNKRIKNNRIQVSCIFGRVVYFIVKASLLFFFGSLHRTKEIIDVENLNLGNRKRSFFSDKKREQKETYSRLADIRDF